MSPDSPNVTPHSTIAEKAVVSAIFSSPDLLAEAHTLTEDHFHLPATRLMFRNLSKMAATGKPFDHKVLLQTALDNGTLDNMGGPVSIAEVMTYEVDAMNFPTHMATLTDRLARRMAIRAAEGIVVAAHDQESIATLLDATSGPINAIHDTLLTQKPSETMLAVCTKVLDDLRSRIDGKLSPMGMATGIPALDRKFRGIHRGHSVIISGYPSGGKSVLAGQLCAEAFKDGHNTLFVSLEMSKPQLINRLMAYLARIEGRAITDPREYSWEVSGGQRHGLDKGELLRIQNAAKTIYGSPFEIEHLTGATEQVIAAVIRKHHRKNPLALVVIDYAQRVRPSAEMRMQSREQQLSYASKLFADLAKELNFGLLLLSQLNKEGAAKHAEALNEDCDLHLQIAQDKESKKHLGIGVPKDRHHGQSGSMLPVVLDEKFVCFVENSQ